MTCVYIDDHIDDHMDDHIDDHRFSAEYLNTVEVSDMRTYEEFKSESFSNNNNISNEPLGIMSTTFKLSESISDSKRAPIATPSIGAFFVCFIRIDQSVFHINNNFYFSFLQYLLWSFIDKYSLSMKLIKKID